MVLEDRFKVWDYSDGNIAIQEYQCVQELPRPSVGPVVQFGQHGGALHCIALHCIARCGALYCQAGFIQLPPSIATLLLYHSTLCSFRCRR